MTTAKPPARYGAIGGARPGGFALPSYTTSGDTTLRLTKEAKHLREKAEKLPPGEERDTLFKRARRKTLQADALRPNKWLSSRELQPPK
ncbi:hypothetical protein [Bradyrhizobium sp. JR3.5]